MANLGTIFNSLLSAPLNRAELVDIHLAAILDSPPCMVIITSLVEKGYEADIWRARLGIKMLHADGLAALSLGETGEQIPPAHPLHELLADRPKSYVHQLARYQS
jgi:hypothetical protein